MLKLKDKVAVVTGGASGIGLAIARYFAAEGARVAILDMNLPAAEAAAADLERAGHTALAVRADVSSESEVNEQPILELSA